MGSYYYFIFVRALHPQVLIKLKSSCIEINSVQLDESGHCVPLVIIHEIRSITLDHVEYTMKWSDMGEKMAKIVFKLIKDHLE